MTKVVADKRELSEMIMAHAIERVHKLGFRMKVGGKSGSTMKIELGALNLFFYSTDLDSTEAQKPTDQIPKNWTQEFAAEVKRLQDLKP